MLRVQRARRSWLPAALTFLALAGCASANGELPTQGDSSSGTASTVTTPAEGEPPAHVRTVGPADNGHEVVVRFGELLDVVPAERPGGWQVADYPKEVLRLRDSAGPGAHHVFVAVALGAGEVRLVGGGTVFTVRVRVLRDFVQPPQP
jgi:hypothetical protein